jgi:hypothetical protein
MLSPTLHRALVWLLALLLPMQGVTAAALMAMGPLHVHKHVESAPAHAHARQRASALEPRTAHILAAFGHVHASAAAERHHHPHADASVVHAAEHAGPDRDDNRVSPSLASFVALVSQNAEPLPAGGAQPLVEPPAWFALTRYPKGIERPPRRS